MTQDTDPRPIGQRSTRKPPHVGPLDPALLPRGLFESAKQEADRMADRDEVAVRVFIMRDALHGGGLGLGIRPLTEPVPSDCEVLYTAQAPAEFTGPAREFFLAYFAELADEVAKKPEAYAWAPEAAPLVARRMVRALVKGTGNKDSNPMRRACRKLGITHTYKAIGDYLKGGAS